MINTELFENEHIETLGSNIGIIVSPVHTFGTDALLLAHFAEPKRRDIACDFGTGCGIIPFIWVRDGACKAVHAVEIQGAAHSQLIRSIEANGLEEKITPHLDDLKNAGSFLEKGSFDLVTMNPPYKADNAGIKSENENEKIARHETLCNINDVSLSAAKLLKFGGRFCVCIRPERLYETMRAMDNNRLQPKRLRLVKSRSDEKPWLCLIESRLGGKSGMTVEKDLVIYNKSNCYTDEMLSITEKYREE